MSNTVFIVVDGVTFTQDRTHAVTTVRRDLAAAVVELYFSTYGMGDEQRFVSVEDPLDLTPLKHAIRNREVRAVEAAGSTAVDLTELSEINKRMQEIHYEVFCCQLQRDEIANDRLLAGQILAEGQTQPLQPAKDSSNYQTPRTYRRDEWIYQNIGTLSFKDLKSELPRICGRLGGNAIESKKGIKDAADRYADFHGIDRKRWR